FRCSATQWLEISREAGFRTAATPPTSDLRNRSSLFRHVLHVRTKAVSSKGWRPHCVRSFCQTGGQHLQGRSRSLCNYARSCSSIRPRRLRFQTKPMGRCAKTSAGKGRHVVPSKGTDMGRRIFRPRFAKQRELLAKVELRSRESRA